MDKTQARAHDTGATAVPRDAVLYIPGLDFVPGQSLETITRHLAAAMEDQARGELVYEMDPASHPVTYTHLRVTREFRYCTAFRKVKDQIVQALDVYELDYLKPFVKDYQDQHPLILIVRLLWMLLSQFGRVTRFLCGARTWQTKAQAYYALGAVLLIVLYVGVLAVAGFELIRTVPAVAAVWAPAPTATPPSTLDTDASVASVASPDGSSAPQSGVALITPWIVLIVAVFEQVWPDGVSQLRKGVQRGATHVASMIEYLRGGQGRVAVLDLALDLLEYMAQQESPAYDHLYIVTHSFGGIIALDMLYPKSTEPRLRARRITGLVTLGLPLEMCQLMWPEYFEGRAEWKDHALRWLNVYIPQDVLASDFRTDGETAPPAASTGPLPQPEGSARTAEPERVNAQQPDPAMLAKMGITCSLPFNIAYAHDPVAREPGLADVLTFAGFRAHTAYFDPQTTGQSTCFREFVPRLLAGTSWVSKSKHAGVIA